MFKSIEHLTTIPSEEMLTFYFYCRDQKVLLPIETKYKPIQSDPDTMDTMRRVLCALESRVTGIKIYHHQQNVYYTYLEILKKDEFVDINIDLYDAIQAARMFEAPILIKDDILQESGLKITKELIEEALA
jgi:bifunctional DNase/RNase